MKAADWMRTVLIGAIASVVAACASIGRPEGGPKDELPPEYVRANPAPGSVNVDKNRIDIYFNENIKLDDPANKVVISPAQKQNPSVMANGRKLTVELRDSMLDSTTYTFDFSDAIRDLNEGNILDGFAVDFSTGPELDTMRISGMVFQARNLEPAQGMVVGVYSNLEDSAISTLPLERIAKTNQLGQFTIRNLKPGSYRVFAINDMNHDWHWDRSENVAFYDFVVSPSVIPVNVTDTLASSEGTDSLVGRTGYRYLPDDVLLTWFNEDYRPQYLREFERTDRQRVTMKFGDRSDSLPKVKIANGPLEGRDLLDFASLETREGLDSLVYWFKDSTLIRQDSLLLETTYFKTDSLDQLSLTTDTLKLFYRTTKRDKDEEKTREKEAKERAERYERWMKEYDGNIPDSLLETLKPKIDFLQFKAVTSSSQDLHKPLVLESPEPLLPIDTLGWRLEIAVDTLWQPVNGVTLMQDTLNVRQYIIDHKWEPGAKYRFTADSLALMSYYGKWNKEFTHSFTVKELEEYGNLYFRIKDAPDSLPVMVELLNSQDNPVSTRPLEGGEVTFTFIEPGTYYARAYIDRNGNGEWDTGNILAKSQPEDVFYYPKKLNIKKNWDIDQEWGLYDLPVDMQKPYDIKKNKPKTREKDPSADYGDEDEFDEDDDMFDSWGNGSTYNNSRRNNTGTRTNRSSGNLRGAQTSRRANR